MQVHEFVDEGLGHSSYVIDLGDGNAAIVDPPRFPAEHEALIDREGWVLRWTIDTHSHADYVTGSPGLVARRGVTFIAPGASNLDTPHQGIRDGEQVALAPGITLAAIATPGHTPDHHAYTLDVGGVPVALFTGGSLMVGTVGRTDLCGPELAVPLAHEMFRSLHRFDDLPDTLTVYPTHGAGSFCSAPGAAERTSTLGRERATNPLLSMPDEEAFVGRLVDGFGTFPTYFARLPELNRRGPTRIDTLPTLPLLDADEVERHVAGGAVVVDARPFVTFGAGNLPGSMSNTLRPVFGSWLGWLVPAGTPLVFILDPEQDRQDLVRQCLDVGHEHLVGELAGGVGAWAANGRPVATIPVVGVEQLGGTVVDVRQANEYAAGHVTGARNVELGSIATAPYTAGEAVAVMCGHGERAMSAASLLATHGVAARVFDGGPDTWAAATGQALEVGR
jgi:glyoxylase-like metal-dependent hydrolase (beta-lactamase superfamily II)/rhodanese-related sulfurtransferase